MAIEATARDKDIPAAALEHAKSKAAEIETSFEKVSNVRVVLDTERHSFRAQFTATVVGENFAAEAEDGANMVKAIDDAWNKLFAQIRKRRAIVGDNRKS